MTINDEFFKKTQENLRRIKAQNNQKTMKNYGIDGKSEAEELPSTQPQTTQEGNVIVVDFKNRKGLNTSAPKAVVSEEERLKRIKQSIQNINNLMSELRERNKTND
jgi:lipopolysaccharide export LptBFGC system permease protein LptF